MTSHKEVAPQPKHSQIVSTRLFSQSHNNDYAATIPQVHPRANPRSTNKRPPNPSTRSRTPSYPMHPYENIRLPSEPRLIGQCITRGGICHWGGIGDDGG